MGVFGVFVFFFWEEGGREGWLVGFGGFWGGFFLGGGRGVWGGAHLRVPAFENTTKIPREDTQRDKRAKMGAGEGKKREMWGPPLFGTHPSGLHHDTHHIPKLNGHNWIGQNWIGPIGFGQIGRAKPGWPKRDWPKSVSPHDIVNFIKRKCGKARTERPVLF